MSGSSGGIFAGALSGGITGFIGSGFNPLGFIAGAALGGALGAAQVLLAPKPKKATHDVSDHIGSTSQRNIPVAIVFGRARIGAQYLILPPGDGQSIYMGTKAVDNQARVYLLHCQVSFGEGLLPPNGIGNYRISGKCITDYWIELSNKKVDPQWEDGTATEKRNATFFFDINRGSGLQAISNMILDVPYTNADLDNVLQPGSTPKPNGFSIDDGSGNRVLANTRMPIVPFRHTVTAACQLYTGYDVSLLDITADRAGANMALYDSGTNSGVNPGDTAGGVVGYDSYDQSFYWTLAASSGTVTPFGIAKVKRDGSGGRTITRPPDGVTSNIARAWYYGKSDIVIMQDPSNSDQFFLGNWAIDPGSDLWETITPHTGQIPGGYDNQILAEHFDELNGILHTIHDDGSVRYIVRWNPLTGVVERVDTDMDSTAFRGMCYSADLYAYIIVDNDTIYAVSAETGETFASTTAMDVTAMKGVFVSGVRVGVIRTNGVNYWDTHDPANTYGRYGNADTDLDKGHFGGVTNAVQNTRTGQVAMTKPIDGTVAWINFIGSVCEDLQDISALGTSGQDQFQVFFGGYSEVPTGNTHSWNTGAVQEPYFQKVDPPVTQYTRTSGNISLQTSAKDDKLTFGSGSALDDLLVMVKQDEGVTDDWNGTAIRPTVHFTIPDDAIVIANTTGSFMSQENSAYYASCPKIFSDGDHTVNFPDGSHDPSVVDDYTAFQAAGFNVQFFNAGIDISVLQDAGFIDGNGVFKCRLYHICCGRGQATVSSMGFISESIPQVDPDLVAGPFRDWSVRTFNSWDMVRLEGISSLAAAMWNIIFDRTASNSGRYGGGLDASLGDITSFEAVHSRCVAGWKYPNKPKVVLQSGSESDETSVPLGENLADTGPSGTPDTSNSTSTTNGNSGSASDTDISHISQTYRMAERYKFDFLLQEQTTLSDLVLEQMLAACNGYMVMAGGVLQVGIPLPGYFASWHFEENSIEDASVSLSVASGSGIINRVRVQYLEVIDDYRVNTVTADREYDQMKFGRVGEKTLTLSGIGRQGHAQSIADQVVDDAIATRQSLVWKTHFVGFAFKPGDVIEISYRNTGLARAKFRITAMDEREKKTIQFTATEFKPTLATLASLAPAATPIGSIQTTIGSEVIHGECEEQTGSTGSGIRWFNSGAAYGSGHYNLNYVTNCAKITPQTAPGGYIVQGWDVVTRKSDNTIIVLDSAPAVTNPPGGWFTEVEAVRANAGQAKTIHMSVPGPIGLRLRHIPQYTNTGRYGPAPTYELCLGDEVVLGSHSDCNCTENDTWLIGQSYAVVSYNMTVTDWQATLVPGFTVSGSKVKLYWDGTKFAGIVNNYPVELYYTGTKIADGRYANNGQWQLTAHTDLNYDASSVAIVNATIPSPHNACKCHAVLNNGFGPGDDEDLIGEADGPEDFGPGRGYGSGSVQVCTPVHHTSIPPTSSTPPPTSNPPPTSSGSGGSCTGNYHVCGYIYDPFGEPRKSADTSTSETCCPANAGRWFVNGSVDGQTYYYRYECVAVGADCPDPEDLPDPP